MVALPERRGSSGETLTLTGTGFTGATEVDSGTWSQPAQPGDAFALTDPVKAHFHIDSDTKMTATVPSLAPGRRCWVAVITPSATSASDCFYPFLVVRPQLLKDSFGSFAVRPSTVVPSGDGSFLIRHIRWSSWRTAKAFGLATVWIDNGIPNEAQGTFYRYPGSVVATRVRGGDYTRLTVHWRQNGHRHAETLKLVHRSKHWWWN